MKLVISAIALAGALAMGTVSASAQVDPYCDQYARDYAKSRAGGAAIGGAVVGGIGGALLGNVLGGKNAMLPGAAVGALGGGVVGGSAWKKQYNAAYVDCMTSRQPVAVAPQAIYLPPVGSKQWKQMCAQKYKSFNKDTGYYIAQSDLQPRLCQLP